MSSRAHFIKARWFVSVVLCAMSFTAISVAYAEKEPTLEETVAWLITKLDEQKLDMSNGRTLSTSTLHGMNLNGCQLVFKDKSDVWFYGGNRNPKDVEVSLDLGRIDIALFEVIKGGNKSDGLVVSSDFITVYAPIFQRWPDGKETQSKSYNFPLYQSERMGERVIKAFSHAAKLCGKKEEPF
jgi:hypothetical protein